MSTTETPSRKRMLALALGTLGVVYGDIGTSPLYALKECFRPDRGLVCNHDNVLGILSLIFWSLTVVVGIKYQIFILRADNKGEGGIFALLALIPTDPKKMHPRLMSLTLWMALFGVALLYGDGMITPAISVLSAIEGLEVATTAASPYIVPLTCLVILGFFTIQRHGTGRIGWIFGPIMMIWFGTLFVVGFFSVMKYPSVLAAINPWHGVTFFMEHRFVAFLVLGSVVLAITGAEALYADMGHFGKKPIQLSWYSIVFPALLMNYFGQGALLLHDSTLAANPFYGLVPRTFLYPMVILSTLATVIASQAMVSGAFSLTRQAVQFGYCPRMRIIHTSDKTLGQIYIPAVNNALMVACIGLVLAFRSSSSLASAYGVAVTMVMTITTALYFFVLTQTWNWPAWRAIGLVALFLFFDLSYLGANVFKIAEGGWFPITVALFILTLMTTWNRGRREMSSQVANSVLPLDLFLKDIQDLMPHRVKGTAIFMSSMSQGSPPVLLHHFKHNQVLHQQVVLLSVVTVERPYVAEEDQVQVTSLGQGFYRVVASYGFMQSPDVLDIMKQCGQGGLKMDLPSTSFYLGRETLLTDGPSAMARWRKRLFALISRNAQNPTAFFGIPPGRVVELGVQINL